MYQYFFLLYFSKICCYYINWLFKYRALVHPEQSKLYQTLKQGDDRRKIQSKLQVSLSKQKELLKKDILKKRALLEKELQIDIQVCILNKDGSNLIFSNWTQIHSSNYYLELLNFKKLYTLIFFNDFWIVNIIIQCIGRTYFIVFNVYYSMVYFLTKYKNWSFGL